MYCTQLAGMMGYLQRMKDTVQIIQIWKIKMQGKRGRGRPKKMCDSMIEGIL